MPEDTRVKVWDHHGGYKWVYFPEPAKQLIEFFLWDKVRGRHLDLAAGWYTYHPNTTAVDLSPRSLAGSCAKEKLLFDLEEIGQGKPLPFQDHSFGSASIVSGWQYLRERRKIIQEVERVLIPGSELYIINDAGAGLSEVMCGPSSSISIEKEILEYGYDCIRERIPFGRNNGLESVTVAMPERDLFTFTSRVRDRTERIAESKAREQAAFFEDFAGWETRRMLEVSYGLRQYPVTEYSFQLQEKVEGCAQRIKTRTGKTPFVVMEHALLAELELAIPGVQHHMILFLPERKGAESIVEEEVQRLRVGDGVGLIQYSNYLGARSREEIMRRAGEVSMPLDFQERKNWEHMHVYPLISFVTSIGLTQDTRILQAELAAVLAAKLPDFERRKKEMAYARLYRFLEQTKQERRVGSCVAQKRRIQEEAIPTRGYNNFYIGYEGLEAYTNHLVETVQEASNNWPPALSDD